jgi:hypothetical protein
VGTGETLKLPCQVSRETKRDRGRSRDNGRTTEGEILVFLWMNEEAKTKTTVTDCIVSKNDSNLTAADAPRPWGSHYGAIQKGETEHQYLNE